MRTAGSLPAAACAVLLAAPPAARAAEGAPDAAALTRTVRSVCVACHNDYALTGGLSLQHYEVERAAELAPVTEKMIRKLRAGMMPPPGVPRPPAETMEALAAALEARVDAAGPPDPGRRSFQRLNQAEYAAAVRELLDLDIDGADWLPLDTKSAGFDNIADAQPLSPALLGAYLSAAERISRLAVGDAGAPPASPTYTNPGYVTQWERVDGAPFGTRGGISVTHHFPADGEYVFRMAFDHSTTGGMSGSTARGERIEVSIDGRPAATLPMDQWMHVSDPNGLNRETEPVFVAAGPRRVSAAFPKRWEGPLDDLLSPHDWSLADRQIGVAGYGVTALPHLKDLSIRGPFNATGVSDTPSRRRIFSCRPTAPAEEAPCARAIVGRLADAAWRGRLDDAALEELLAFYRREAAEGGFEAGVRAALQAILASPDFVFRLEREPARTDGPYPLEPLDLAARLSFFLWGAPPDRELRELAAAGGLAGDAAWERQLERMLADPRARALGSRFARQWLRLEDLEKVHPDRLLYPDFSRQLAEAMRVETEMLFNHLVREDRPLLELFTADYTFANEALARHYGLPGVAGRRFRQVPLADPNRRGILGHGSVLTLTSHAGRTSPVLRGKWVMEVLLGAPPPPPPPDVPELEATGETREGRFLTTRERMAMHRADPSCNSCHQFIDPIGLALDNFDVTGRWRIRENAMPLDASGEFYDGTPLAGPADLRAALLARPEPLARNFTANLMAYALGRRIEHRDMPAVRRIAAAAAADGHRLSAYIKGVAGSAAFRMKRPERNPRLAANGPGTQTNRQGGARP